MLIRFDDYLIHKVCSKAEKRLDEPPATAIIGTEMGVAKVPFSKKYWIETDNIMEMMPDWLREALMQGPIVSMSRADFNNIPMEVQQYGEILSDN